MGRPLLQCVLSSDPDGGVGPDVTSSQALTTNFEPGLRSDSAKEGSWGDPLDGCKVSVGGRWRQRCRSAGGDVGVEVRRERRGSDEVFRCVTKSLVRRMGSDSVSGSFVWVWGFGDFVFHVLPPVSGSFHLDVYDCILPFTLDLWRYEIKVIVYASSPSIVDSPIFFESEKSSWVFRWVCSKRFYWFRFDSPFIHRCHLCLFRGRRSL